MRRHPSIRLTPVLGLGLLVLGVVAYSKPEESRKAAMEIATRVSSKAVELWEAAGWREVAKAPKASTRGYRAPQRFVKPDHDASAISSRIDVDVRAASHAEVGQDEDAAQKPQVKGPALAAPGNTPKLRQLGIGVSPKLQSAKPYGVDQAAPNGDAATAKGLNAPSARKVRNPYAIPTSDEGQTPQVNANAVLETEESAVGSGVAVNKTPSKSEISVLKRRPIGATAGPTPMPTPAPKDSQEPPVKLAPEKVETELKEPGLLTTPKDSESQVNEESDQGSAKADEAAAEVASKPRKRPSTALLLDATPTELVREGDVAPPTTEPKDEPKAGPSNKLEVSGVTKEHAAHPAAPATDSTDETFDHHPSNFLGVTPGVSDESATLSALGKPISTANEGAVRTLRFGSDTFKQVNVDFVSGVVETVTLILHKPLPTKDVMKELGLTSFEPGLVTSGDGYVLGQVFPERGVILEFAQAANGSAEVDQITLERIQAEPFLLRALDDKGHGYASAFSDLEVALKLDPNEPRAYWLKANLLCELGRHISALRAVDEAIRLDSVAPGYHLTRAKILLALGKHGEASRIVNTILAMTQLPPHAKARALSQQAELFACGPDPDFDKGVEAFRLAIREASTFAEDGRPAMRRLARRVLIESHLGVARCIAWGQLEDAEKASAQWNERARLLAETAISDEDLNDDIWLAVHRSVMSTHLGLAAKSNPDRDISELQLDYKKLLRAAADPAYRDRIKWEVSLALTDASRIESARGKHRAAGQFADTAWSMMAEGVRGREECGDDDFARGMLLYQLGSIAAVAKENHAKAVEWYEQAVGLLEKPLPESLAGQKGLRGLAFIGMGASYWETGDQKQALLLSELGAKGLQEAANEGRASREALNLAYGNLESMYRDMGDRSAADRVAKLSAGLEKTTIMR